MHRIIIADTSTLIIFQKIEQLDLLQKIYGKIITTHEVAEEFGEQLPKWIQIKSVSDKKYQTILETQVDIGEASVITLAIEMENTLLILDDLKARKLANRLNLTITGTLGIIHKAKQMKVINSVKPLIEKLLETDFRISESVINEILKLNNELLGVE